VLVYTLVYLFSRLGNDARAMQNFRETVGFEFSEVQCRSLQIPHTMHLIQINRPLALANFNDCLLLDYYLF